jgi:hypothetical protein
MNDDPIPPPLATVKEAFDAGWQAHENGDELLDVDPYGDEKLFQSYRNGWRSRHFRMKIVTDTRER